VSSALLFRVGLVGLLTWTIAILLASIAPIWSFVGVRATTLVVPFLVAAGFAALFVGLLSLLAAIVWAVGAHVHRRWRRA